MKRAIIEAAKIHLYEKNNPRQPAYAIGILCAGLHDRILVAYRWTDLLIFEEVRLSFSGSLYSLVIPPFLDLFQIAA